MNSIETTGGQDAHRHPARFLTGGKRIKGRAQVVFILVTVLAVLVLILAVALKRDDGPDAGPAGNTAAATVDGSASDSPEDIPIQYPAPKPEADDPAYLRLQISLALYMAALAEKSRALPHEFDKIAEADRKLKEALESFGEVGEELLLLLLGEFTHETNPARRAMLLGLIARFCDERTAHLLLKHYNELPPGDRRALIRGMAMKDMDGLERIFDKLIPGEKITATKNDMLDYMLAREDPGNPLKGRLFEMFDGTHDAAFRIHIMKELPRYGEDAEVRDFYESVLSRERLSTRERLAAMYSFAESHGSDAVPQISRMLDSDNFKLRASAVKALEFAGGDEALQILDDLARNDPDERIRKRAAASAKNVRNPPLESKPKAVPIRTSGRKNPGTNLKVSR